MTRYCSVDYLKRDFIEYVFLDNAESIIASEKIKNDEVNVAYEYKKPWIIRSKKVDLKYLVTVTYKNNYLQSMQLDGVTTQCLGKGSNIEIK